MCSLWVCSGSCRCLCLGRMKIAGHPLRCTARKPGIADGSRFATAEDQRVDLWPCSSTGGLELSLWRFSGLAGRGQGQRGPRWAIPLPGAPSHQHLVTAARVTQGWLPTAAASRRAPASVSCISYGGPPPVWE